MNLRQVPAGATGWSSGAGRPLSLAATLLRDHRDRCGRRAPPEDVAGASGSFPARPAPTTREKVVTVGASVEPARCREIVDGLSEFLDGELDPPRAAGVALHLSTCPACAGLAAELVATIAALHRLPRRESRPGRLAH